MPNRQEHLEIAVAVAIVAIVLLFFLSRRDRVPTLSELLGVGTGVMVVAVSPDRVEPATTPNHRRTAHSLVALGGSVKLCQNPPEGLVGWRQALRESASQMRWKRQRLPPGHADRLPLWLTEHGQHFVAGFTIGFPLGYTSHLVADGWKGKLPLV